MYHCFLRKNAIFWPIMGKKSLLVFTTLAPGQPFFKKGENYKNKFSRTSLEPEPQKGGGPRRGQGEPVQDGQGPAEEYPRNLRHRGKQRPKQIYFFTGKRMNIPKGHMSDVSSALFV
jgi:hypothetical protein